LRAGKGDDLLLTRGAGSSSQPAAQGSPEGAGNSQGTPATGDKGDPGNEGGGKNAGTSHNPNLRGEASNLKSRTKDVTAVAADTGQGAASSEVIYGAAQRGFVGGSYRKIYTDYHTVAEQVLNRDQIPPGYRFYVQRYFQLIRPRE
jgi:hypothetical protein